jgi:hypothetical protein
MAQSGKLSKKPGSEGLSRPLRFGSHAAGAVGGSKGGLFVVGLQRWGGGARRQQAGFAKAEARLPQSKSVLVP